MAASVDIAGNRRCSVYLNNVGCALMKQGSFQDAMKTFSDAVFVMKHGVCSYLSTTPSSSSSAAAAAAAAGPAVISVVPCLDLQEKMKRSDQRLAFHQASSRSDKASFTTESFKIIELDDYLQIEIDDLLCKEEEKKPAVVLLCPIRIDADLTNSISGDSMELISGTMLYNLGLSHSCLAKVDPTFGAPRQEHRGAATCFLQLANCILRRLIIANPHDPINQDCELGKLTAMTNIAVIHSLYQVLVDSFGSDEGMYTAALGEVCLWHSFLQDCVYMNEWTYMGGLPYTTTAPVA